MNGQIMLYVPKEKWMNKLFSYQAMKITRDVVTGKEVWTSIQRKQLLHLDDLEILRQYNAEIRGLYNYYKIANNATVLDSFGYMMKYSMYKTLAAKYHTKVKKIREKYRIGKDFGICYETKSGIKTALFYNDGFRRQTEVATGEFDTQVKSYFRSFSLLLKKLGIPHRGFHALRHTFATRALECGMDVKTLSEILGHKNPVVTLNRYAHSLMPHKHEAMNRLGKLF